MPKAGADVMEWQPAPITHDKNAVRLNDGAPVDSWVGSTNASDPALAEANFAEVALDNPKQADAFAAAGHSEPDDYNSSMPSVSTRDTPCASSRRLSLRTSQTAAWL